MLAPSLLLGLLALAPAQDAPQRPVDDFQPDPAWKALGDSLWFDAKGRRVVLRARVVLREGALEHLLCGVNTKEHESILATPARGQSIHTALLLTGAEVGHTVRFRPKFEPPAGTPIVIELEWTEGGKAQKALARDWVMDLRKKKPLELDWVFAGSEFFQDAETKKERYAADEGDLITVANFTSAILDIPIASSDSDADRTFVTNTAKIPKEGTFVTVILRPKLPAARK